MGFDSPWHWIIVVIVLAALFGYKKLPDMSRSVARSLRIFKTEMKGLSEDDAARRAHADSGPSSPYGENPYATGSSQVTAPASVNQSAVHSGGTGSTAGSRRPIVPSIPAPITPAPPVTPPVAPITEPRSPVASPSVRRVGSASGVWPPVPPSAD